MNHIDPNITTLCTHAGATDAPDITIDPMLDRGSTLAAPQTANTTNGYELLLNGWYEIGVLDRSPLGYPLQWTLLLTPTTPSPFNIFGEGVTSRAWAVKVL